MEDIQPPLTLVGVEERQVLFRQLVQDFPSTTYATFSLYKYPAKFIPQVIAYALKTYARRGMSLFDPFAGYGTAGVVARVYGLDYELWDLNPLLGILHEVSTMEPPHNVDVSALLREMSGSRKEFVPHWDNLSYWFPEEFLPLLFRVWGFYHSIDDKAVKNLLVIPLLKTTRFFSYNDAQRQKLSRSPLAAKRVDKLRTRNWKEIFFQTMTDYSRVILRRLEEYRTLGPKQVNATVRGGVDALKETLSCERDILITSPPYLQAQEYIRGTKLDLFWLGFSEAEVKDLNKKEIPYREVDFCTVHSKTYSEWREQIREFHLKRLFDRYFWGVLGALTRLQEKVSSRLFLFVGSANLRGRNVPIHRIFLEHFTALGWVHEVTLVDAIVARTLFSYGKNPATGLPDRRMSNEHLLVLRK